jgi:GlpG protein
MRIIGHLPNEASAATFSDFLYVEGITNLVEPEKEGWAVWIHSEDQLEKARELLSGYLGNPRDPKYRDKSQQVAELKRRDQEEAEAVEKRVHDRSQIFRTPFGLGPLTMVLVGICVAVWGLMWLRPDQEFLKALYITKYEVAGNYLKWTAGLPEIRHGEVWRLITPIFIHAWPQPFHLIFNVYALFILGTMIEMREGAWRLGSLVLVIAALSNFAQYYFVAPNFCGISGVVYGLFGYIWMKSKFDPGSGFYLHPQTVMMMLMWFVLCLVRVIPNIANTVHGVGLGVGVAWGFLSSLTVLRARPR